MSGIGIDEGVKPLVTKTVVRHVIDTHYEDLPPEAVREAKRSLLNWIGAAIGGARHPAVDIVLRVSDGIGGPKQATVLGRGEKADLLFASLVNGMASHIHDFDDTLLETVLHPSAPVFPAVLSYAEHRGLTGKDVLLTFVLGCEVEARLARCLYPSHYWRGWHITGTVGAVGAAVAVGKLMGLDEERLGYAVGLAATAPTGLREMFGTMTKSFHPGKAAMNGVLAALLAEQGLTSSLESLEAKRGYGHVLSDNPKFEYLTEGWGDHWEIVKNSYKPFASGVVTHPAIDAAIFLRNQYNIVPDQIQSVEVEGHPLVEELTGKKVPKSGLEGKFSIYHCVAAALVDGRCGVRQFTDGRVTDPTVSALREKVRLLVNGDFEEDQATVTLVLKDGQILTHHVEHCIGSSPNPMTDKQLEDKFIDLTEDVLPKGKRDKMIDAIWRFEAFDDLRPFFAWCSP